MSYIVTTIALIIVFISSLVSVATLSSMSVKYAQCKEHLFSQTPECSLVEMGTALSSGMSMLGISSVVAITAVFLLVNSAVRGGSARRSFASLEE